MPYAPNEIDFDNFFANPLLYLDWSNIKIQLQDRRTFRRDFQFSFLDENANSLWSVVFSDFDHLLLYLSKYGCDYVSSYRSQKRMLQRNLIYTAITRAKKLCILVGDDKMFEYAVNNIEVDNRLTSLKQFLFE